MSKLEHAYTFKGSRRGYLLLSLSAVALATVLLVSPLTAYLSEKSALTKTKAEIVSLQSQQSQLERSLARLNDPNELAYMAKTQLNMVYAGQKSYFNSK